MPKLPSTCPEEVFKWKKNSQKNHFPSISDFELLILELATSLRWKSIHLLLSYWEELNSGYLHSTTELNLLLWIPSSVTSMTAKDTSSSPNLSMTASIICVPCDGLATTDASLPPNQTVSTFAAVAMKLDTLDSEYFDCDATPPAIVEPNKLGIGDRLRCLRTPKPPWPWARNIRSSKSQENAQVTSNTTAVAKCIIQSANELAVVCPYLRW